MNVPVWRHNHYWIINNAVFCIMKHTRYEWNIIIMKYICLKGWPSHAFLRLHIHYFVDNLFIFPLSMGICDMTKWMRRQQQQKLAEWNCGCIEYNRAAEHRTNTCVCMRQMLFGTHTHAHANTYLILLQMQQICVNIWQWHVSIASSDWFDWDIGWEISKLSIKRTAYRSIDWITTTSVSAIREPNNFKMIPL